MECLYKKERRLRGIIIYYKYHEAKLLHIPERSDHELSKIMNLPLSRYELFIYNNIIDMNNHM